MSDLSPVQEEIYKAISQMSEKASFTEFQIAKKIRENTKFDGKKKAGISLADLEASLLALAREEIFYSIHINSVNECLLRKEAVFCELALEARQRRQKSEKSMTIFTSSDFSGDKHKSRKSGAKPHAKRSERNKLSVYDDFE